MIYFFTVLGYHRPSINTPLLSLVAFRIHLIESVISYQRRQVKPSYGRIHRPTILLSSSRSQNNNLFFHDPAKRTFFNTVSLQIDSASESSARCEKTRFFICKCFKRQSAQFKLQNVKQLDNLKKLYVNTRKPTQKLRYPKNERTNNFFGT